MWFEHLSRITESTLFPEEIQYRDAVAEVGADATSIPQMSVEQEDPGD